MRKIIIQQYYCNPLLHPNYHIYKNFCLVTILLCKDYHHYIYINHHYPALLIYKVEYIEVLFLFELFVLLVFKLLLLAIIVIIRFFVLYSSMNINYCGISPHDSCGVPHEYSGGSLWSSESSAGSPHVYSWGFL